MGKTFAFGRVRHATRDDVSAIDQLMRRAQAADGVPRISEPDIDELMALGEWIVLELPTDELVGAACVTGARGIGHVACLVSEPSVAAEVEARLRGVAAAINESR